MEGGGGVDGGTYETAGEDGAEHDAERDVDGRDDLTRPKHKLMRYCSSVRERNHERTVGRRYR